MSTFKSLVWTDTESKGQYRFGVVLSILIDYFG